MKTVRRTLSMLGISLLAVFGVVVASPATPSFAAGIIGPDFEDDYTLFDLGAPEGVPVPFGGVTIKSGDSNVLLIGGAANSAEGAIYEVPLTRDAETGQITGYAGPATLFSTAPYIDGGLSYAPGEPGAQNLLFTAYPTSTIGQILPGASTPTRIDSLNPLGIEPSVGALVFTPGYAAGAGALRVVSYHGGGFYNLGYKLTGDGTFDFVSPATLRAQLPTGAEGIAYVPAGSAGFEEPSLLVSNYTLGDVSAYETDFNGFPLTETRRDFITGLDGAEGAYLDPVSGEFMFSTFNFANSSVLVARGFASTAEPPVITTTALVSGTVNAAYADTVAATGDPAPEFAVTEGALPSGLSLNSASGLIDGAPTQAGDFAFTITATNSEGSDSEPFTVTIDPELTAPVITTDTLPNGEVGVAYDSVVSAMGYEAASFAVTDGVLPDGVELDAISGAIAGEPTLAGDFAFTITATNATGSDAREYSVTIASNVVPPAEIAPEITTLSLPGGTSGTPFSATVVATGDPSPTFTVDAGSIPTGLTLNATSGELSGTPTAPDTYSFTVLATNSAGVDSQQYTVTIAAATATASNPTEAALASTGFDTLQLVLTILLGVAVIGAGALLIAGGIRSRKRNGTK